MLCEGHTEVTARHIDYAYDKNGIEERIHWTEKNIAEEFLAMLAEELRRLNISVDSIDYIDVISGGDHGKGAFIAVGKVIVFLKDGKSFSFEMTVAEILCRKDNAELLSLTIKDLLTQGLQTMAKDNLYIKVDKDDPAKDKTCFWVPTYAGTLTFLLSEVMLLLRTQITLSFHAFQNHMTEYKACSIVFQSIFM